MRRLAGVLDRHRRRVLVGAGVVLVLSAVLGLPVVGALTGGRTSFQDPHAEAVRTQRELEAASGQEADLGLVVLVPLPAAAAPAARAVAAGGAAGRAGGSAGRTSGAGGAAGRGARAGTARRALTTAVAGSVRKLRAVPGIERVAAYDGRPATRALLRSDGRQTLIAAAYSGDADDTVAAVRHALGPDVRIGGRDVAFAQIGEKVSSDLGRAEAFAFPILLLLGLLIFRSVVAALLPLLIGGFSIVVTFVGLRLVDSEINGLSVFALNLVTGMGLGLAIDYSLFIVSRYREEVALSGPGPDAMARTLATAGRTVLFSAGTITAALAALLPFRLRFLYSMGVGGMLVALVAAAAALIVLPTILLALGERLEAGAPARWRRRDPGPATSGGWYRLAQAVQRRPVPVAVLSAAVLLAAGVPFLGVRLVPSDVRMLPAGSQTREVADAVVRDYPRAAAEPIQLAVRSTDRAALVRLTAAIRRVDPAGRVAAPQQFARGSELDVVQPGGVPAGPQARAAVARIRSLRGQAGLPGFLVGGSAAQFADQRHAIARTLPLSLAILGVGTVAVLFLMTGSLVLPVKTLVMNLLSISAAFGLLVLIFQDGHLSGLLGFESAGGLEITQPVLLFVVAFGLATDYGVFLLSRIKEGRDAGLADREAVAAGVERTGRLVTAAALLFCVAIGAFATSGITFIKQLGVGTALAVAIDATFVRALLVPALMALLGKWNWWAPAPLRRLHDRFGLTEVPA